MAPYLNVFLGGIGGKDKQIHITGTCLKTCDEWATPGQFTTVFNLHSLKGLRCHEWMNVHFRIVMKTLFLFYFLMFHALRCEGPFQNWDSHVQIKMKSFSGQDTGF